MKAHVNRYDGLDDAGWRNQLQNEIAHVLRDAEEEESRPKSLADVEDHLTSEMQRQMNALTIEGCDPLAQIVAMNRRVAMVGRSDQSMYARFLFGLNGAIYQELSRSAAGVAAFGVSMGIRMGEWCERCSVEFEPDYAFVEAHDAHCMPNALLWAVSMLEIAWTNRPCLDAPPVFDPGLLFQKLQSYVMVDFSSRRLVLFRRATGWQPELFTGSHLPTQIDGLDFEIDWRRAYKDAGGISTSFPYLPRWARDFMKGFRGIPE